MHSLTMCITYCYYIVTCIVNLLYVSYLLKSFSEWIDMNWYFRKKIPKINQLHVKSLSNVAISKHHSMSCMLIFPKKWRTAIPPVSWFTRKSSHCIGFWDKAITEIFKNSDQQRCLLGDISQKRTTIIFYRLLLAWNLLKINALESRYSYCEILKNTAL